MWTDSDRDRQMSFDVITNATWWVRNRAHANGCRWIVHSYLYFLACVLLRFLRNVGKLTSAVWDIEWERQEQKTNMYVTTENLPYKHQAIPSCHHHTRTYFCQRTPSVVSWQHIDKIGNMWLGGSMWWPVAVASFVRYSDRRQEIATSPKKISPNKNAHHLNIFIYGSLATMKRTLFKRFFIEKSTRINFTCFLLLNCYLIFIFEAVLSLTITFNYL